MEDNLNSNVPISSTELGPEARMAKNSFALFLFALITKGAGLIIAVLIARYLGAAALGTYASVLGLSVVLENLVPLGQPMVIIRSIARDKTHFLSFWLNTSFTTTLASVSISLILVLVAHYIVKNDEYASSVTILALYLPIAGLYGIAQSFIQGLEQMDAITITALIGRVAGLLILFILLQSGQGVTAAFISNGLFLLVALLTLSVVILRKVARSGVSLKARLDINQSLSTLRVSIPFAIQTVLRTGFALISILILPLFVSMETVGMFDAADRIRQTSMMIIPIVTLSILPTLSRLIVTDRGMAEDLIHTALKLVNVLILPFSFFTAISADQIIPLLYGPGYEAAVLVLRIVVWAQVFFAADAVLNQVLIVSDNEVPMVRHTIISLGVSVILLVIFASRYGAIATAWIVLLTQALNLILDAVFVRRRVTPLKFSSTFGKPLFCAFLGGCAALVIHSQGLWVSFAVYCCSYMIFLRIFKVFSFNEVLMARRVTEQLWRRVYIPR